MKKGLFHTLALSLYTKHGKNDICEFIDWSDASEVSFILAEITTTQWQSTGKNCPKTPGIISKRLNGCGPLFPLKKRVLSDK